MYCATWALVPACFATHISLVKPAFAMQFSACGVLLEFSARAGTIDTVVVIRITGKCRAVSASLLLPLNGRILGKKEKITMAPSMFRFRANRVLCKRNRAGSSRRRSLEFPCRVPHDGVATFPIGFSKSYLSSFRLRLWIQQL